MCPGINSFKVLNPSTLLFNPGGNTVNEKIFSTDIYMYIHSYLIILISQSTAFEQQTTEMRGIAMICIYSHLKNGKDIFKEVVFGSGFVATWISHDERCLVTRQNESSVLQPQ